MDHAEARERLELAAVEPGGLDRLMAGDTADAALVAGHLAGCPDCTDELVHLRRDAAVIREVIRAVPPADLRERTLGRVRAVGRDRSGGVAAEEPSAAAGVPPPTAGPSVGREERPARWLAAVAAVLVLAVIGTAFLVGRSRDADVAVLDAELQRRATAVAALERVASMSFEVAAEADARRVALNGANGTGTSGTLVFSPSRGDLVVIARGLADPGPGREFRCWFEVDGERQPVGRMFFAEDLSFWAGPVDGLEALGGGGSFGITLVDAAGDSLDGAPVLSGGE